MTGEGKGRGRGRKTEEGRGRGKREEKEGRERRRERRRGRRSLNRLRAKKKLTEKTKNLSVKENKQISSPKASNGQGFPCPALLVFQRHVFFICLGGSRSGHGYGCLGLRPV